MKPISHFAFTIILMGTATTALAQNYNASSAQQSGTGTYTLPQFSLGDQEFYGWGHWGVALSFSSLSNPAAPNKSAHSISGLAIKLDYKKYNLERGGKRMFFQHKTIGDLLFLLSKEVRKGQGAERAENSTLSTGLIGWTSWGWNVLGNNKSSIAVGFNLNDYIVGSTYVYTNAQGVKQTPVTTEPQGYYWGGGPSFFYDHQLTDKLVLQSFLGYSLAFWRAVSLSYAQEDKAYPKPHYLHLNAEVQTSFHLYAGFDFTAQLNRGDLPNKTKRLDLLVGYRF